MTHSPGFRKTGFYRAVLRKLEADQITILSPPEVGRIWGNTRVTLGLNGYNGKENGNYCNGFHRVNI